MSLLSLDQIKTLYDDLRGRIEDGGSVINFLPVDNASGSIATFPDGADNVPVKSLIAQITPVQSGTGDPAPDNIRPISGWTGAEINVTGINVWDEEWEQGAINDTTGENQPANDNIRSKNYIPVKPNTTYYGEANGYSLRKYYYDINKNLISHTTNTTGAFTTPENCVFLRFRTGSKEGTPYGITYNNDISINYPSTDTSYHSGTSNTTTEVSWTDEAGTVYGGTLNVTTGELKVTWGADDMGNLTYQHVTTYTYPYFNITGGGLVNRKYGANITSLLSSIYKVESFTSGGSDFGARDTNGVINAGSGSINIKCRDSRYSDEASIQTGLAGQTLIYELATPITYQLTPTEVKTLLGDNNIFVDTGDVSVDYRADIALYIQKVVNA